MLFVVYGHINLFGIYGNELITTCQVSKYTSILQLPLFMFLSGLVASSSPIAYKQVIPQLFSKARQLLVPFLVVGGIFAYAVCQSNISEFLLNSSKLGYWYLWVLFLYYILHYIYRMIASSFKKHLLLDLGIGGGIYLILSLLDYIATPDMACLFSLGLAKSLFPAFFAGVIVKRHNLHTLLFVNKYTYLLALIFVIGFILTDVSGNKYFGGMVLFQYGFIIVLMHLLSKLEDKHSRIIDYLTYVGRNTLDVYIYHYFILQLCKMIWLGPIMARYYSPIIELIVTGLLTLIVCTISIYIGRLIRESIYAKTTK